MKRIVSGIQPTANSHIGNYLGAMKYWPKGQADDRENFYFIANLHALTSLPEPELLKANSLAVAAWLLAVGVNPEKSVIFAQSHIPAHSELTWILNNFVTMGELSRMTQYKEKSQRVGPEGQIAGLFEYPVLMAADIIIYDADEVPVGKDQVQHIELARKIASRFNTKVGKTFKLPQPIIRGVGAKIMDLQKPSRKMDKSNPDKSGVVLLSDPSKVIKAKILGAVTDSGKEIRFDTKKKPSISNLLEIYSAFNGKDIKELEKKYQGKGYAEFKADLADVVISKVAPLQEKHQELMAEEAKLLEILEAGQEKASAIAGQKLAKVKTKLGLL